MNHWFNRLLAEVGILPGTRLANDFLATTSKHERGTSKPRDWRKRRAIRRKMAKASRRRNR